MRFTAAAVVLLTLAPAAPAGAAAVSLRYHASTGPADPAGYDARIQSGRDEVNHLVVASEPGAFTVRESSSLLLAGEGCAAQEDGSVRCVATDAPDLLFSVSATLGDGADELVATGPLAIAADGRGGGDRLEAGSGVPRAVLSGGDGDDVLIGTPGPDRLDGGSGRDQVTAGEGDDQVTEGDEVPAAPDVLDGGPGLDLLSYVGRREGVTVDLTAPVAGQDGEADAIAGFESASGGDGPDRLSGDAGPNDLRGGLGADRLDGRAGDDVLDAGAPRVLAGSEGDRVAGGPGADRLTVWPGDVAQGGPGADVLTRAGGPLGPPASIDCGTGVDLVTAALEPTVGCETLAVEGRGSVRGLRVGRGAIALRWVDGPEDGTPCGIAAHAVDTRSGRALGPVVHARTAAGVARLRLRSSRTSGGRVAVLLARATSCRADPWPTVALATVPVG